MSVRNQFLKIHSLEGNEALKIMFEVNIFQIDRYSPHLICGDGGFRIFDFFLSISIYYTPPSYLPFWKKRFGFFF